MSAWITFLGGVGEIGANSTYFYFDGTGVIVDAGLHPTKRNKEAFPCIEPIREQPTDILILSHAHTDHIGALPYFLKQHPHLKLIMTKATRDLLEIMLKDTTKLLKSSITTEFPEDVLSLYNPEMLEKINIVSEGYNYFQGIDYIGRSGRIPISIMLYPSGHILGSASIYFEFEGQNILMTSDVNFTNQHTIAAAKLPQHHIGTLIIEATNGTDRDMNSYDVEKKRLAKFINKIVNQNGSILIPCFALGKSQEVLKILNNLMKKGSIPNLNIYTAGMQKRISRIYDKYCYSVEMLKPGYEVSDIRQEGIRYDELYTGRYFKEPSIVLVSSGMMNNGTLSYNFALHWFRRRNYGIAFVGYQDAESPGYAVQNSKPDIEFKFTDEKIIRKCEVASFRFTSHATFDSLLNYIQTVKPMKLFIVHGDPESSENLSSNVRMELPQTEIIIPVVPENYYI